MKYRLICLLLVQILLLGCLCACKQASEKPVIGTSENQGTIPTETVPVETQPPLVYDEAPAVSSRAVTIDGVSVEEVYEAANVLYFCPDAADVKTTHDGSLAQTDRGSTVFYGTFCGERTLTFDNESMSISVDGTATDAQACPLYDGERWYLPLRAYYTALGYTEFDDAEQAHLYYTDLPDVSQIPDGCSVPILMYHAVSDDCWGIEELFVSPSSMEAQLQYLNDNGYTTIWFSDLPHIDEIEKPVLLTFDDGYDDNYEYLFPLLKKYNCKATIFVISTAIGKTHKMTAEQVRELSDSGLVDIESHTMTHPDLDMLGYDDTVYELEQSRLEILRLTGKLPYVLCYPTGYNSSITREVAAEYYSFGIIMNGGRYTTGSDLYQIPRHYVSRYTDIGAFAGLIAQY